MGIFQSTGLAFRLQWRRLQRTHTYAQRQQQQPPPPQPTPKMAKKKAKAKKGDEDPKKKILMEAINWIDALELDKRHDRDRIEVMRKSYFELQNSNEELTKQLVEKEIKLQDIEKDLKKELEAEKTKNSEMKDAFDKEKYVKNKEIKELNEKIRNLKEEHRRKDNTAEDKYRELKQQYSKVECFKENMEKTEAEMKEKDMEIARLKKKQSLIILDLETRYIESKEDLRADMQANFDKKLLDLQARTQNQLHATTKRTIQENENMSNELHFQTRETERIIKQNDKLLKSNKELKIQIELLNEEQRILVQRSNFYKKMNKRISEKLHEKTVVKKKGPESGPIEKMKRMVQEIDMLRNHVEKLESAYDASQGELLVTQNELEQTRKASEKILDLQDEGTTFLLACLQDSKLSLADKNGKNKPEKLNDLEMEDREALLKMLLQKLNRNGGGMIPGVKMMPKDNVSFPPITSSLRNPNSMT